MNIKRWSTKLLSIIRHTQWLFTTTKCSHTIALALNITKIKCYSCNKVYHLDMALQLSQLSNARYVIFDTTCSYKVITVHDMYKLYKLLIKNKSIKFMSFDYHDDLCNYSPYIYGLCSYKFIVLCIAYFKNKLIRMHVDYSHYLYNKIQFIL